MKRVLFFIIDIVTWISPLLAVNQDLSEADQTVSQEINVSVVFDRLDSLNQVTVAMADSVKFGAYVYMPSLYWVNKDGSLGNEVSVCRLIEESARDKDTLRFKVLNPPSRKGTYAFVIKDNSFSVIPDKMDVSESYMMRNEPLLAQSRTSDGVFKNYPVDLCSDTLRILHISNSYGENLLHHIDGLLKAANTDVSTVLIERLVYSGGSFKNWYDVFRDKNPEMYWYFKMTGGLNINIDGWEGAIHDGTKFRAVLEENKWDLILLNQASRYAPDYGNWDSTGDGGYLPKLLEVIRKYQPEATVGFLLIHSYAGNYSGNTQHWSTAERWERIRKGVEWIKNAYNIDFVVPYGTAIENLRLTAYNNIYDLTGDGIHLAGGLAQYTAGCCYFERVFSPRFHVSVCGNKLRLLDPEAVSTDKYSDCVVPVDDAAAETAQKAAFLATHNMFEIRNPDLADLKDYVYGEPLNQNSYCFMFDVECGDVQDCAQRIPYRVVSSTGMLIGGSMSEDEWMQLPKGLYIRNGEKILKTD